MGQTKAIARLCLIAGRSGQAPGGAGAPAPPRSCERQAPSAATTFEKTFWIWLPMVKRITMTTIETRTRIRAYSTIPWPFWRLCRLNIFGDFPPFLSYESVMNGNSYNVRLQLSLSELAQLFVILSIS